MEQTAAAASNLQFYLELVGYISSFLVAVSLSMKSVWRLRIYNLLGSLLTAIYGYAIGAAPIVIVNAYISVMDAWYLADYMRSSDFFSMDSLINIGEAYFMKFYNFYQDDIRAMFPDVKYGDFEAAETSILFRNMIPVGILALKLNENPDKTYTAQVVMDYVIPEYRDFKLGGYLYNRKSYLFRDRNITKLVAYTNVKAHQTYLLKVGFKEETCEKASKRVFVKEL